MTSSRAVEFAEAAQQAFEFLVSEYGYTLCVEKAGSVAYEKHPLSLRVFREPNSYMIYVEIDRADTGEMYVLHEILHALAPDEVRHAQCGGSDKNSTRRCLDQLGRICRTYLGGILTMDVPTLAAIAESANQLRRKSTLEYQYGPARSRANRAWDCKDWETARKFYQEAKTALSATEQRRLDFLLKEQKRGRRQ